MKMVQNSTCPHRTVCPGCRTEGEPVVLQQLRSVCKLWDIEVPYVEGVPTGWRSRAKLAVRVTQSGCAIGLFKEHSHDIVPIACCLMHTAALNRALEILSCCLRKDTTLSFYNEKRHQGALRYLLLSEETSTSKVAIVFVVNLQESSDEVERWVTFAKELLVQVPSVYHSFWINFQHERSNKIVGKTSRHVVGDIWQWEHIRNMDLPFHPLHFRQANLPLFSQLVGDLENQIQDNSRIVDLFGGMGAIGLLLSHKAKSLLCVEIDKEAEQSFNEAKKRLKEELRSKLSFRTLSCDDVRVETLLEDADTIIVDPPRKGLSSSLIATISRSKASTLAYISCSTETLLHNFQELVLLGWKPVFAKSYQFFPMTEHLESLVVFKRS